MIKNARCHVREGKKRAGNALEFRLTICVM